MFHLPLSLSIFLPMLCVSSDCIKTVANALSLLGSLAKVLRSDLNRLPESGEPSDIFISCNVSFEMNPSMCNL